jgi:quercetin dioxygenase-like cupin family protein
MTVSDNQYVQEPVVEIRKGVFRSMIYMKNLMLTVIDFTNGPWDDPEPYHSHPHEQISYIAGGELIFYCEGQPDKHLKEGDVFAVPSGKKHTVKVLTERVRIIDSFNPIREDFLK